MARPTEIKFYKKVPLDSTNKQQFTFATLANQASFFTNYSPTTLSELKWISNDSVRIDANDLDYEDLLEYNYLSYKNKSKTYYCFIDEIHYINDNVTQVDFSIDYFQTYLLDHELGDSFVEREHRDRIDYDDNNYLIPIVDSAFENIDVGSDLILDTSKSKQLLWTNIDDSDILFKNPMIVVTTGQIDTNNADKLNISKSGGIGLHQTPYYVYVFLNDYLLSPSFAEIGSTKRNMTDVVSHIPQSFLVSDKVVGIFPLEALMGSNSSIDGLAERVTILDSLVYDFTPHSSIANLYFIYMKSINDSTAGSLSNIKIKPDLFPLILKSTISSTANHSSLYETKLLSSEFLKMNLQRDYSISKEIKGERINWYENNFWIVYKYLPFQDFREFIILPKLYYNESNPDLIIANDKSLPYANEAYYNYINQSKAQRQAGLLVEQTQAVRSFVGAAANLNVLSTVDAYSTLHNSKMMREAKEQDLKTIPDSVRSAGGNIGLSMIRDEDKTNFNILKPSSHYLNLAYQYMRKYGYKTAVVKKPNLKSRLYYNYIETRGANILPIGNINNKVVEELRKIYDGGVLLFHPNVTSWSNSTYRNNVLNRYYENWEVSVIS